MPWPTLRPPAPGAHCSRAPCPPAFRFAASRIRGFATSRTPQNRADVARDAAARFGVEMTPDLLTLGHYDLVVTIEAPDDESATAFALAVASGGNMRMKTLRAFSKNELAPIIGKLGRQHATKGRHLAGFPSGRLFSPRLLNPFVAGRALALASPLPVTTPSARSRGRGGTGGLLDTPGQGVCGVRTTLPAAWRICRVGLLAARDRPASSNHDKAGLLAHCMETPAHANAAGRRLFSTWDFFPLHRSGVVVPDGRDPCIRAECLRAVPALSPKGTEFTSRTPPARQEIAASHGKPAMAWSFAV